MVKSAAWIASRGEEYPLLCTFKRSIDKRYTQGMEVRPTRRVIARVRKTKRERLISFLRLLGWISASAALVVGVFLLIQAVWHPFDSLLSLMNQDLWLVDSALSRNAVGGISFGAVALVIVVAAVPLFGSGVRRKQYAISYWRGLLSSAIFLLTDTLYRVVLGMGSLYFSATILLFFAATLILVEIVSRVGSRSSESDTRTELLAAIVSGLSFGLIVQFGAYIASLTKGIFPAG